MKFLIGFNYTRSIRICAQPSRALAFLSFQRILGISSSHDQIASGLNSTAFCGARSASAPLRLRRHQRVMNADRVTQDTFPEFGDAWRAAGWSGRTAEWAAGGSPKVARYTHFPRLMGSPCGNGGGSHPMLSLKLAFNSKIPLAAFLLVATIDIASPNVKHGLL